MNSLKVKVWFMTHTQSPVDLSGGLGSSWVEFTMHLDELNRTRQSLGLPDLPGLTLQRYVAHIRATGLLITDKNWVSPYAILEIVQQ